jgi:glycosyltransferase involved in cell wall biosynthesis
MPADDSAVVEPKMVSILTPVLNAERFITDCIENVLLQGCPSCEHVVIDGGSTDSTLAILHQYAERHPGLRVLSRPHMSQSEAMNLGLAHCRGEIVSFLNADDFYADETLNEVLRLFPHLPSPTLLVGNCNAWNGNALAYVNRPKDLRFHRLLLGPDFVEFPYNPSAYFYHRAIHDIIGPYNEQDDFSMDLDFVLRAVQFANVVYVDKTLGNMRIHPESKTARAKASGDHPARIARLLNQYRRQLPPTRRAALYAELGSRLAVRRLKKSGGRAVSALRDAQES